MSETLNPESIPPRPTRRRLLQWCAFILGGLASAAMGIPIVGYLLSIVIEPVRDKWIKLDELDLDEKKFPVGQTRLVNFKVPQMTSPLNGETQYTSAYVRRLEKTKFQVFAINCAHLGCPVEWFPQSGLFMCPCHGGVYYEDGSYASGPPPRGLYEYEEYRIKNGKLEINGGHLPTLQAPLPKPDPGAKA